MIIVNKDDISSAVKQAKAMIKPSLLALENSLRFTAKQSRLFLQHCPFLHRKVWNSYLIAGKKSSY